MRPYLKMLMKETAINESSEKGTLSLMLAVMMKYGMAPIACIYLGWILLQKDQTIDKYYNKMTLMIESQTAAMVKNSEVTSQLTKVIETNTKKLEEIERKK